MKLLFVDDCDSFRAAMARLLSGYGLSLTQTTDGMQALALLKTAHREGNQFSFVVTDGKMPRMNGLELITKMKGDPVLKEIPVVLITGDYENLRDSAVLAGAKGVFRKLGDTEELIKCVLAHCQE